MTGAVPAGETLDPRLDRAISLLMDAAGWAAAVLLPLGLVSLVSGLVIWLALPLQWVNDGGWRVAIAIGAVVVLALPGVLALRVRSGLRDAVAHEDAVKRDVARLLVAVTQEGDIRARIADAAGGLRERGRLRAVARVGRELLPLTRAARATNERYEALAGAFGPGGLGELWFALLANALVIVAAPVVVIVGVVLFVV
jgi:hypothetical protein